MSHSADRDSKQRRFGCIGFSMMAHVGVLALLALAPHAANEPFGAPEGNASASTGLVDLLMPGSAPQSEPSGETLAAQTNAPQEAPQKAPREMISAQADDASAVPVLVETKPVEKLPEPKAKVKSNADNKKPAQKNVAENKGAEKVASEKGDLEIKAALTGAREKNKKDVEERPVRLAEKVDAEPTDAEENFQQENLSQEERDQYDEIVKEAASDSSDVKPVAPVEEENTAVANAVPSIHESEEAAPQADADTDGAMTSSPIASAPQAPEGGLGNGSGSAARAGNGSGYGIPLGVQIRDANMLREASGNRPPTYPLEEKLRRKEGTAVIVAKVRVDGSIDEVRLERSSGSALIDQAALQAYKNWRYLPGQEGWVRKGFLFRLTGDAKINPAQLRRQ